MIPEAPGAPSVADPLAEWIFDQHQCSPRMTSEALYAEARALSAQLGEFKKTDFLAAFGKVYASKPHAPPATGWPLRSPYSERARAKEITNKK